MRPTRPASRSASSQSRCSRHSDEVVHLLDLDAAAVPPELRARLLAALRPPSSPRSSSRRPRRRAGRRAPHRATRSAPPYIGEVSKSARAARRAPPRRRRARAPRRCRTSAMCRGRRPGRAAAPPSVNESLARRPAANAAAKNSVPRRPRDPCGTAAGPRTPPASRPAPVVGHERRPRGRGGGRLRVMGEPRCRRVVARRNARREHGSTTERSGCVHGLGGGDAAVTDARPGADDARPDGADDDVEAPAPAPRQRRADVHRLHVSVDARPRRDRHARPARASLSARTASENETGSAPPASWTYATRTRQRRADRGDLASAASSTRRACRPATRRRAVLLHVRHRVLQRRVRELHHVSARLGRQPEAAREVRVQHVEAARAELQLARLHVHDHVVPEPRPAPSAADTRCTARRRPRAARASMPLDDRR